MKTTFSRIRHIFDKVSTLIEKVPPEHKAQFEEELLKNSVFRIRFLAIFLLIQHLVKRILLFYSVNTYDIFFSLMSSRNDVFHYYIEYGFLAVPLLVLVFTGVLSKTKNSAALWVCCYGFVLYYYSAALLNIYFAASTLELVSVFTIILFLILFVPDFKYQFMPSFIYFTAAILITSRLSDPHVNSLMYVLFFMYAAVCIVKRWHYNSRVKVFVNALQMKELNEKLESLSVTDELTKLHNRRSFLAYFDMVWKQAERLRLPVNALMIDIDYFKKYNDSLGHLEGDKALVAVAQCLRNGVKRETDFVARFGGEEFVCLLPYISKADAEDFAEKLVQSVGCIQLPHPDSEASPCLTISAGMASIIPAENSSPARLLDEADRALYAAKQSGRNRVAVHESRAYTHEALSVP